MLKERKKNRLKGFDYTSDRLYFVTSCTQDKNHFFGEIINQKMICNEIGLIACEQWIWLQQQFPYIISHGFVIMPNHIHAVLEIRSENIVGQKIKPLSDLIGAYKTTSSKQIHLSGNNEFKWQRSFHDHIIRNEQSYWNILNYIENNPKNWRNDRFFND